MMWYPSIKPHNPDNIRHRYNLMSFDYSFLTPDPEYRPASFYDVITAIPIWLCSRQRVSSEAAKLIAALDDNVVSGDDDMEPPLSLSAEKAIEDHVAACDGSEPQSTKGVDFTMFGGLPSKKNVRKFASKIAMQVRLKLGPNPQRSAANRLVAWELANKFCEKKNVRSCDRFLYCSLATPMVFVRNAIDLRVAEFENSYEVANRDEEFEVARAGGSSGFFARIYRSVFGGPGAGIRYSNK